MQHPLRLRDATPALRVSDVAHTLAWYREMLNFDGAPFPAEPPHEFCILRHGEAELMLRQGTPRAAPEPRPYDWDLYLRVEGENIRELYAFLAQKQIVTRRLERMHYGQAEFEVTDPDGYTICIAQPLAQMDDLPTPEA